MSGPATPPRHILVVDDEPTVCEAVKMLLEFDGHKVVTVNTGQEALTRMENESYDLLITDYFMPEPLNGNELARRVRVKFPKQPIVMITAWPEKIPVPLQNVDMVISKPFLLENLREAIRKTVVR